MSSERQLLETVSPWWGEHIHRYEEVIRNMKGNEKVLDIACGTGFGSDLLAKNTKGEVTGGDISSEAISENQKTWDRSNLKFEVLDGTSLPHADHTFDILVSFETIEHTTNYLKMVSEFARVLKPEGIAFISTPNFPINSPSGVVTNPFHTQEFIYEELVEILASSFQDFEIKGQKYSRYNRRKSLSTRIAQTTENLLYQRGIRKLPISVQDSIMRTLNDTPMYPTSEDYEMTSTIDEIKQCKTFFAICRK